MQRLVVQLLLDLVVVVVKRLVEQVVGEVEKDEVLEGGQDLRHVGPVGQQVVGEVELGDVLDPVAEIVEVAELLNVVVVERDDVGQHAMFDLRGAGDEDDEAEVLLVVLLLVHVLGLDAVAQADHLVVHLHSTSDDWVTQGDGSHSSQFAGEEKSRDLREPNMSSHSLCLRSQQRES